MSPPNTDNHEIKDERWAIKTFRPLLQELKTQNIPLPPDIGIVYMADKRDWIIKGMGRCIVIIEQQDLPEKTGGILITSHDPELDYFRLHILINSSLCNKTDLNDRADLKITATYEFTHAVAALSAISRVRSELLIGRLKGIFREKAHAISYDEIKKIAEELSSSLFDIINNVNRPVSLEHNEHKNTNKEYHFPDMHFRLGFEDFPVSYPVIFEEFLLSKEMFEEYFSKELIDSACKAISENNANSMTELLAPLTTRIVDEKALYPTFVIARIVKIFMPIYATYILKKKH